MNPNQIIQNYRLVRKLGEGGMGEVWLAEHQQMNRKVAIKFLHPHLARNADIRKRFKEEAENQDKLSHHPNIPTLYEFGESENEFYMIMEYVEGQNLSELIANETGPMPMERILPLLQQMASAIDHAHAHRIIHRDIKPGNIIVSSNGSVKVLDFGIAKAVSDSTTILGGNTQWIGTASYMSPEQINQESIDHRTDIYSLGLTLYAMATGKPAYEDTGNPISLAVRIISQPLPDPKVAYADINPRLSKTIKKATSKNPKKRHFSCMDIYDDLKINHRIKRYGKGTKISVLIFTIFIISISVFIFSKNDNHFFSQYTKDSDHDGVKDNRDLCPYKIGTTRAKGCPDADYDGIPNHLDKSNKIRLMKY